MKTINNMNCKYSRLLTSLVVCSILIILVILMVINFSGFVPFCNSDSYADCQVAKEMWEQKTLFPEGWSFGNQVYIIATPVLAAALYGMIGNINIAMNVATAIMTLLIMLSFLWLVSAFTEDPLKKSLSCLFLLTSVITIWGPKSVNALLFFSQASFYSCYLITLFVVFGDYARSVDSSRKRVFPWIISLLLSFATGMQSLRQTVIMVLPILAYEGFQIIRCLLYRSISEKNMWSLVRGLSYGAANLGGIVTIQQIPICQSTIYGEMEPTMAGQLSLKIKAVVDAIAEISGLHYILSEGFSILTAMTILFFVALVVAASVLWILRIHKQENELEICWALLMIGIVGVFLSTIVLDIKLRSIYIFMWFPLASLSGIMVIEKLPHRIKSAIVVCVCFLSIANTIQCNKPYMKAADNSQMPVAKQFCDWTIDNGYEFVYGDYWGIVQQIAAYSEGELKTGCWHGTDQVFKVEKFNTFQNIYGEEENASAIYVFSADDENAGLEIAQKQNITLTKVAEFGGYSAYISSAPLMEVQ